MTKEALIDKIVNYVTNSQDNFISEEDAIYPNLIGMNIYETPLVGFAYAADKLFTTEFKKIGIIHPEYQTPLDWLPGSKTVISFFLPSVYKRNKKIKHKS